MFTKNKSINNFSNWYLTNSENKNLINGGQNVSPVFHYYQFNKNLAHMLAIDLC